LIDKADFRIPWSVPYTREFQAMVKEADAPRAAGAGIGVWRKSQLYERMGNFEVMGLEVVLHERCTMTKMPNHKLEILKTGEKTLGEIHAIARQMFHAEPWEFGVLRTDLTADIDDVPVRWFRDHTVVASKRTIRDIGLIPQSNYMTVAKGNAMTIYAGVKPNQIRIYDKTGERLERWHRECQRVRNLNKKNMVEGLEAPFLVEPTFEQMFGYSSDQMITRVENQISGKNLERIGLNTMHDLWQAADRQPFSKIRFINDKQVLLCREDYTADEWMAGLHLQAEAKAHGIAATKRYMYEIYGNKNFYRKWAEFLPFIQNGDKLCTYDRLQKSYEKSCYDQLHVAA
jgi:hypothetical protein